MTRLFLMLTLAGVLCTPLLAQQNEEKKSWEVADPPGDWGWKEARFTVDEGTCINPNHALAIIG